jgi:hypothetical protein
MIEKNIPIPSKKTSKYGFSQMEVGDSVFIAGKVISNVSGGYQYLIKNKGWKFTARIVEGGVRIWRIA